MPLHSAFPRQGPADAGPEGREPVGLGSPETNVKRDERGHCRVHVVLPQAARVVIVHHDPGAGPEPQPQSLVPDDWLVQRAKHRGTEKRAVVLADEKPNVRVGESRGGRKQQPQNEQEPEHHSTHHVLLTVKPYV